MCVSVCWSYPYYILLPTWIPPCWEFPPAFLQSPQSSWPKITWHAASALGSTPPGEDITVGEELIRFQTRPTLASAAATNSKHRPECLLQAQAAQKDGETERSWWGEFIFLDIIPLYILAQGWTEGISSYFLTQNMSRLKAQEDSSFNRPVSLSRDEPRIASIAFAPPAVIEPK